MLGINHTALRLGNIMGLTISGLILSVVDWRGLFYVNIPIGIFGTVWAHLRLKEIAVKDTSKWNDWTGFFFFSGGLTSILLAITFFSYGLSNSLTGLVLFLVGLALILYFVKLELRIPSPLLDLSLFRIKLFAMGNIAQLINSLSWYGALLLLAFYLQIGLGYPPLQAGIAILPMEVVYLFVSIFCGKLSDIYGSRGLTTLGLGLNAIGFLYASTFSSSTSYLSIALCLVLIGIGNGMFTAPNLRAVMGSVPPNRVGIASGFRQTMFNVGLTCSYGLTILLLTLGIPYGVLSQLLQSTASHATNSFALLEFLSGFRIAMFSLAVIDSIAIIPSAIRGSIDITVENETSPV